MKQGLLKTLVVALLALIGIEMKAVDKTYSPVLDVSFRTNNDNTAWNSDFPKSASTEGNTQWESNYFNGFFALQQFQVADLQYATKLVLTITVGSNSGVDAHDVWLFTKNDWTATSGIDDIEPTVAEFVGVAPHASTGTANTPLVKGGNGVKVADSNPAKAAFSITGDALTKLKASATSDGKFTLLITNNSYTSDSKRTFLTSNTANAEANRPTLVATLDLPTVLNKTTGVSYKTLTEAFNAAVTAGTDAELEVSDDQTLSARLTLNKAMTLTITPTKDITIKAGGTNYMWFLANVDNAVLNVGGGDHTITLDGQNKQYGIDVTKYENTATIALTNVVFQNFDLNNTGHLVGSKENEGLIQLEKVTFKNCTNPANAFVNKLRVTNDRVVLKGYLNQENCTGTTIYAASETKPSSGTTGRIKIDDADFTASNPITIEWNGTKAEGIVVVVGTKGANAGKFKLTDSDWKLVRKASNGDLYMTTTGWLEPVAASYTHPGLLHTAADITRVKGLLTTAPFDAAYSRLESLSGGSAAGAVEYLKRLDKTNWESTYSDYANFTHAATDAKLAYELALRYQLKGSTSAASAAVNILNNWATTCKGVFRLDGYTNDILDPNEYLLCIQAYQFANAAELLRDYSGWNADDFTAFKTWMRETFGKLAYEFLETHHGNANPLHYWLNWDLAALTAMYSVGVLCDDKALVDYALNYVSNGTGTGKAANAIVATHSDPDSDETLAQCQESGRDQGHSTLDITLLGVLCQTAQSQGTDLFTPYKALEMAEYVGKYNLKDADDNFLYKNVPFTTYNNGDENHTEISAKDRGTVRPSWELFHAYAQKNGKSDIYTEQWVQYMRQQNTYGEAEGSSTDELGFGTLMFGEAAATTKTVTVTEAGAATLVLPFGAALPTGVKAYTLTYSAGADKVTATEVTAVTANQPVLINAAKGDYVFTSNGTTNTNAPTQGALTGVYATTLAPSGSYILTYEGGVAAFRKVDGSTHTVTANHAYLTAASAAALLSLGFDDVTGLSEIEVSGATEQETIYNLKGQRISKPAKGVYIMNGKKYIMK